MKRLAIIIPYRDRHKNLMTLLDHFSDFSSLQKFDLSVHVVVQENQELFNRGRLLNIGYFVSRESDYYCFHDVDFLPVRADYSYCDQPTHLAARVSQFNYQLAYGEFFGGVVMFNEEDFLRVNGFSNGYYGRGGEADDLQHRCNLAGLEIDWRDGVYCSLPHPANNVPPRSNQKQNIQRLSRLKRGNIDYRIDGISNLTYTELAIETLELDYGFPVSIHHVHFNNHDLSPDNCAVAGFFNPSRNSGYLVKASKNEIILEAPDGKPLFNFNDITHTIWKLCDGKLSVDAIVNQLALIFPGFEHEIERDVPTTIGVFVSIGACELLPPLATSYVTEGFSIGERTVTITAHNRPEYLKRVLDGLAKNQLEGYHLVCSLEPGCEANRKLCLEFGHAPKTILFNPVKLGVRSNPYSVLDYVFSKGSGLNVYLEDDLELSSDVLHLANWFEIQKFDRKVLGLSLNHNSPVLELDKADQVSFSKAMSPLGFVIGRAQWDRYYTQQWFNDEHVFSGNTGWDFSMHSLLKENKNLFMLALSVPRTRHIGRENGTHCTPEHHDKHLARTIIYKGSPISQFRIMGWDFSIHSPKSKAMIAYCFLTKINPLLACLWEAWLAGAEDRVCVHTKWQGATKGLFAEREIPEHLETEWGHISLVRAQLALLKNAFEIEGVTKAMFLSGNCVPLMPRAQVEETLLSDCNSWFMYPHKTSTPNIERRQYLQGDYSDWIKSTQWCCISRADWDAVFREDHTAAWEHVSCPDEHYFIMECAKYSRPITYGKLTWTDWVKMAPHPKPLRTLPVQADDVAGYMFARKTIPETTVSLSFPAEIGL